MDEALAKELNGRVIDEYKDVTGYIELSEKVPGEAAGIFRDIAREEMTHAQIIQHVLENYGQLNKSPEYDNALAAAVKALERD